MTLTLDSDVAAKLKAEARRQDRPFRAIANEALRRGLRKQQAGADGRKFEVAARDLGELNPWLSLDSVADLIEQVEGALHR